MGDCKKNNERVSLFFSNSYSSNFSYYLCNIPFLEFCSVSDTYEMLIQHFVSLWNGGIKKLLHVWKLIIWKQIIALLNVWRDYGLKKRVEFCWFKLFWKNANFLFQSPFHRKLLHFIQDCKSPLFFFEKSQNKMNYFMG